MRVRTALAFAFLIGLGCSVLHHGAQADDAKIQVTTPAWKGYQDYLAQMTPSRHGFLAMSKDGQIWGNSGCTKGQCPADDVLKASAMKRCQQFSAGTPCVIFAEDRNTVVPYQVKDYTRYGE